NRIGHPLHRLVVELESPALGEHQDFPCRDRREPKLVFAGRDCTSHAPAELRGLEKGPQPNVRIEQQVQRRSASQMSESAAGPTMSPTIVARPALEPIQYAAF